MRKFIAMCIVCALCCFISVPAWADEDSLYEGFYPVMTMEATTIKGGLNHCLGTDGGLSIYGWIYDSTDVSKTLTVLIYIENNVYSLQANKYRPDAHEVYGCGEYHGIKHDIAVTERGEHTVTVYALNANKTDTLLLGSYTVTISEPEIIPTATPTATPTPTPTPSPSPSPTPVVTPSLTPATPTATPEPTMTPAPTATPTSYPHGVGREDLDGAETVINDAQGLLDGVYDVLPHLNPGVVGFMGALNTVYPWWFNVAFGLGLTLSIVIVMVKFMWK